MLCDDNLINQKVALRLLQQMGYKADVANNGLECLEALEQQPYDLIFMDVQMPEMDGLEATRQIRKRQKEMPPPNHFKSQIAIVAMTANAMQGDRDKCIAAGMDDYVSKPVRPEDIRLIVERWGTRTLVSEPCAGAACETNGAVSSETANKGAGSEPLVDMERLLDFANGDPNNLRELMELYLQQTGKQVTQLNAAVEARNADAVKHLAHSCAGASSTCGMGGMVSPLRELERQGRDGLESNAPQLAEVVTNEFARIQKFLTDHLKTLPPVPQLAKT